MQNVVWFIDIPVSTGLMRQTQQKSFYLRFNLCHLDFCDVNIQDGTKAW